MKLFYTKGACSLIDRIIINEIGIECEFESVDLKTKKTESGNDFLTINPKGAVPVLCLKNNQNLTENAIIIQYLADTYKADNLLPAMGDFKRYKVLEWVNYMATEVHKSFGPLFNPLLAEPIKEDTFIPLLNKKFNVINTHLATNQYLMGEHFTLPDAYLFVMLMWAEKFKLNLSEMPKLSNYYMELKQHPSIKKSLQDEGLVN